jgi:hypothetical protein
MESVSLYSEARNEYLKQLATWIVPPLVEFFRKEYDRIAKTEGKRVMYAFQSWCSEVPRWNQDVIDEHVEDLLTSCRCDYVEDLMTAVFIAHTKMLTAIRINSRQKKLQITLPKLDHFLHRIFVECARAFWKAPFLFSDEMPIIERQKNILQAESMCTEAIGGAVRSLLPIKSILRDNLLEDEEPLKKIVDSDSDSEDESSALEKTTKVEPEIPTPKLVEPEIPTPKLVEPEIPTPKLVEPEILTPKLVEPEILTPKVAEPEIPTPKVAEPEIPNIEKPVQVSKYPTPVQLIKDDTPSYPEELVIDTEPAVRFSPYDVVFYENKPDISEMRYAPKMSIEDFDTPPKLQIGGETSLENDFETIGSVDNESDEEMILSDTDFETV